MNKVLPATLLLSTVVASVVSGQSQRAAPPAGRTAAAAAPQLKFHVDEEFFKLPDNMVANATRDEVNAALLAAHMEADVFVGPYNPIVINTGAKLIVIDTGTGEAAYKASKGANGQFLTNLAAAGIDANSIDTVIISHYHGDHVNGLLRADNTLAFNRLDENDPGKDGDLWGVMWRVESNF